MKIVFHNVRRIFADIAKDVTHYRPGKEVAPGIEAVDAAGHTPGHTVFALQSGKEQLMVLSDTTQHPALFARHPEWQRAVRHRRPARGRRRARSCSTAPPPTARW